MSTSEDFVLASGPNEWICRHNKKDGDRIKLHLTIICSRILLLKKRQMFAVSREAHTYHLKSKYSVNFFFSS